MAKRFPFIRMPKPKPKPGKPTYTDPNVGSGWTPGQSAYWMAPDWVRDPIEETAPGHWRPKRRD